MERDQLWNDVAGERVRLLGLLESLSPAQFDAPSLCPGWRVRDVAAHVIAPAELRLGPAVGALLRARGDFNRMILEEGRRAGAAPVPEILAAYRRNLDSRRRAPGALGATPLMDLLVHTQDIAIPLGIKHHMPTAAAVASARQLWRTGFPFHARRRLRHLMLCATDADWSEGGPGPVVEGPIEALVLLLTGRTAWLHRLSGPGLEQLSSAR